MDSLRQAGAGILLGIISIIILLGGFSLAMVEGGFVPAASPASATPSPTFFAIATTFPTLAPPVTDTPPAIDLTITLTASPTSTSILPTALGASLTPAPTLAICSRPIGWLPIVVQAHDTLGSLALVYNTSTDLLRAKNCLPNDQLVAGSILYVPGLPSATPPIACGAPANWGNYTVQSGDTLYHISQLYRVTVQQLMQANCLYTTNINAGRSLRVPNVPTSTPGATITPLPTVTEFPSAIPSDTPAPTQIPSTTPLPATSTATTASTNTSLPTSTVTPTTPTS